MSVKHSPSPWSIAPESEVSWTVNDANGKPIVDVYIDANPELAAESEANSRLIEAAPDLLRELIKGRALASRELLNLAPGELGEPDLRELLASMDAAIHKATAKPASAPEGKYSWMRCVLMHHTFRGYVIEQPPRSVLVVCDVPVWEMLGYAPKFVEFTIRTTPQTGYECWRYDGAPYVHAVGCATNARVALMSELKSWVEQLDSDTFYVSFKAITEKQYNKGL